MKTLRQALAYNKAACIIHASKGVSGAEQGMAISKQNALFILFSSKYS